MSKRHEIFDFCNLVLYKICFYLNCHELHCVSVLSKKCRKRVHEVIELMINWSSNNSRLFKIPRTVDYKRNALFLLGFQQTRAKRRLSASTGIAHTVFTSMETEEVFSTGEGSYGQTGLGTFGSQISPERLELPLGGTGYIQQVSCGNFTTFLLSSTGVVYCCGSEEKHKLGFFYVRRQSLPTIVPFTLRHKVSQISVKANHGLFKLASNEVVSFGSGLGLGYSPSPTGNPPRLISELKDVIYVSAGERYSLVLNEFGEVYSFGEGNHGKLGHGNTETILKPRRIEYFVRQNKVMIQISAGANHSFTIDESGVLYSFGKGHTGQLGHESVEFSVKAPKIKDETLPREVKYFSSRLLKVIDCKAGDTHSIVITADKRAFTFGTNDFGKLGIGSMARFRYVPQEIKVFDHQKEKYVKFVSSNAAQWHTLLISDTNELYTCGGGYFGRLGLGNEENTCIPTKVILNQN